jgi:hypothetical protein
MALVSPPAGMQLAPHWPGFLVTTPVVVGTHQLFGSASLQ